MPLPTVQPPAAEAPTPIRMPPKTERTARVADGRRRRNSPEALAAKNAPTSKPRTSSTPQSTVSSRSEEHTSELQSRFDLVCRLLLEKKKKYQNERHKGQDN